MNRQPQSNSIHAEAAKMTIPAPNAKTTKTAKKPLSVRFKGRPRGHNCNAIQCKAIYAALPQVIARAFDALMVELAASNPPAESEEAKPKK